MSFSSSLGRRWRGRRAIPFVSQITSVDCGPACLAMVLGRYGHEVSLEDMRRATGTGRDGSTAAALLEAARELGLVGRGVRANPASLASFPGSAILHWEGRHFVVLESVDARGATILDPASGRRRVSASELRAAWNGIALLLEPGPGFAARRGNVKGAATVVWKAVREEGDLGRAIAASLLLQLLAFLSPLLTSTVVDRVIATRDAPLLDVVLGAAVVVSALFAGATVVRAHLLLALRANVDRRLSLGLLDHLLQLPYAFFQTRPTGDLLVRLGSGAMVREIVTGGVLSTVLDGGTVLVLFVVLAWQSRIAALLVAGIAAVEITAYARTSGRRREIAIEALTVEAKAERQAVDLLAGIETLKAMGQERRIGLRWGELFDGTVRIAVARGRLQARLDAFSATVRMAAPLLLLAVEARHVLTGGASLGVALAMIPIGMGVLGPLGGLLSAFGQWELLRTYLARMDDVLGCPREQENESVSPAPRLAGNVSIDRVSFRYGPRAPLVADDVTIDVGAGEMVAIVGPSGSGKSTLGMLLLGFYRPTAGAIRVDGLDVSTLEVQSLRRQVGVVPQRPILVGSSIRDVISLGDPAITAGEIEQAARLAHVHDEIASFPMGYDTPVVDGGTSLSGGQRQRIALARALVRRPAILVLDEATSSLDALTEAAVHESLASLACTRIVIAHRLSTVRHADRIYALSAGRIVESGRHDALMRRAGAYATLVRAQLAS